jgi:hypothetical protein
MDGRMIDGTFSHPQQSCTVTVTGETTGTLSENTAAWCQFQNDTIEMGQGGPCTSFPLLVKVETKDLLANHGELRHKALCLLTLLCRIRLLGRIQRLLRRLLHALESLPRRCLSRFHRLLIGGDWVAEKARVGLH